MDRLAFVFRTDTHVCDRSPASWKGDYPAEIWNNLGQIGKFAREHKAAAVLDGGDFFHIKSASRNSHALVVKAAKTHRDYPCPTLAVVGNHDVVYNNLETIDQQPLGVLFSSGVFSPLREQTFVDGDLTVRVVGVSFSPFRTVADLKAIKKKPGDTFLIAVVHALAAEEPPKAVEDFFGEPVFRYADIIEPNGPDAWFFGHWHKDQGVVVIGETQFVNLGAVSRGALIRENTTRTPKVALIEATKECLRVMQIPLDVAPAEDVFDFDRKERQETEATNIEEFVTILQSNASFNPDVSIEDNLSAMNVAVEIRDLARDYLDKARAEIG
jgi:DNA repair exonuclease SbcCD nuclease subunit